MPNQTKLLCFSVKAIGVIQILVGIVGIYYGPLEIYVFYLFSRGGQFYYDGFGIGSLWFGYLVIQNIGYYLVAIWLIPMGIGHWQGRRYALTMARLFLWLWLAGGVIVLFNYFVLLPAFLRLELERSILITRLTISGVFIFLGAVLLPLGLLWFYGRSPIAAIFESDPRRYWTEKTPFPLLMLFVLLAATVLVWHLAMFFQAIFPFFGQVRLGRPSAYTVDFANLILVGLIFGLVKRKLWAWWGTAVYFILLTLSTLITFSQHTLADIITMMDLPAYELEFFANMTVVHDYRLAALFGPPLLLIISLLMYTKRYFRSEKD